MRNRHIQVKATAPGSTTTIGFCWVQLGLGPVPPGIVSTTVTIGLCWAQLGLGPASSGIVFTRATIGFARHYCTAALVQCNSYCCDVDLKLEIKR